MDAPIITASVLGPHAYAWGSDLPLLDHNLAVCQRIESFIIYYGGGAVQSISGPEILARLDE
jgi:hypothetical protein